MRFKLDENMPVGLVRALNQVGYNAETVYSESIAAMTLSWMFANRSSGF